MRREAPDSRSATLSSEALFRYTVVSQVQALLEAGVLRTPATERVAAVRHPTLDGQRRKVSARTVRRWLSAYEEGGLPGLEPKAGKRAGQTALPPALVAFLVSEKEQDPRASLPELIRRAREKGVIPADQPVDRTTVWRTCRRLGLPTRMRPSKREGDIRRYSYVHRMQMVLVDGKHFRAGGKRRRRVALFFLDDATRFGLHVVVGTAETTALFLRGLYELVRRHGRMDLVYADHGPGFISGDTATVVDQLGAHLVLGAVRYPSARGKVERFNRTAYDAVLRALDGAADVDPDCGSLELRLRHFLEHDYNERPHEALGGQSPRERWEADPRALRFPDDDEALRRHFVVTETRKVSLDHVIQYGGQLWEAPRGLAGRTVEVLRQVLDGHLFVRDRGRRVRLHPLDPHANARDRRGRPTDDTPRPDEAVPTTAAKAAFDRDFGPVVGPDGGLDDQE